MSRKDDVRDGMEKQIKGWINLSLKWAAVAATALGVQFGTHLADSEKIAELDRRTTENEHSDQASHEACSRFRAISISGFSDPSLAYAVSQLLQSALKEYETRDHAMACWRRLKQLNSNIVVLDD